MNKTKSSNESEKVYSKLFEFHQSLIEKYYTQESFWSSFERFDEMEGVEFFVDEQSNIVYLLYDPVIVDELHAIHTIPQVEEHSCVCERCYDDNLERDRNRQGFYYSDVDYDLFHDEVELSDPFDKYKGPVYECLICTPIEEYPNTYVDQLGNVIERGDRGTSKMGKFIKWVASKPNQNFLLRKYRTIFPYRIVPEQFPKSPTADHEKVLTSANHKLKRYDRELRRLNRKHLTSVAQITYDHRGTLTFRGAFKENLALNLLETLNVEHLVITNIGSIYDDEPMNSVNLDENIISKIQSLTINDCNLVELIIDAPDWYLTKLEIQSICRKQRVDVNLVGVILSTPALVDWGRSKNTLNAREWVQIIGVSDSYIDENFDLKLTDHRLPEIVSPEINLVVIPYSEIGKIAHLLQTPQLRMNICFRGESDQKLELRSHSQFKKIILDEQGEGFGGTIRVRLNRNVRKFQALGLLNSKSRDKIRIIRRNYS